MGVAGDVHLNDPIEGVASQHLVGIEAVVFGVDVDVVDVEEQAAVGLLADHGRKLGLAHLRDPHGQVVGDVLDRELDPQPISSLAHPGREAPGGGLVEGEGQQIVEHGPTVGRETHVVAVPAGLSLGQEPAQAGEVVEVEGIEAAQGHHYAVGDARDSLDQGIEDPSVSTAPAHVVLRADLEESEALGERLSGSRSRCLAVGTGTIEGRLGILEELGPQSQTDAHRCVRGVETFANLRHGTGLLAPKMKRPGPKTTGANG